MQIHNAKGTKEKNKTYGLYRRYAQQGEKMTIQQTHQKDHLFYFVAVGISIILFMVLIIPLAHAEPKIKHIAIEWSEACLTLISQGNFEQCGNPETIKLMFPPATLKPSYQRMFDDSAKIDRAKYQINDAILNHKKNCVKENYCNVFNNYSHIYYWYDPDQAIAGYYDKRITIYSNMLPRNLVTASDEIFVNATSRSLILDTNQIYIKNCTKIIYTPEYYRMIREMGGLMWHILDDCKDKNKLGVLNTPYMETHSLTVIPIDESPNWQILQAFEALKAKYKENMLGKD